MLGVFARSKKVKKRAQQRSLGFFDLGCPPRDVRALQKKIQRMQRTPHAFLLPPPCFSSASPTTKINSENISPLIWDISQLSKNNHLP
jgi:hypothetical protein